MDSILGIGWDVGGWMGGKHGVSVVKWDVGSDKIQWLGTRVCSIPTTEFTPQSLAGLVDIEKLEGTKIIIGIDAPLGYPSDFIKLVSNEQVVFDRPAKEIGNRFAYRDTERYIYQNFRKKPLSATFDKLGNNATVAIYHMNNWCKNLGYSVHPMTESAEDSKIIIEVYPALIKDRIGKAQSPVKELLPEGIIEGTDQYDAAICAVMAIAYGVNGSSVKLPRLIGPSGKWVESSKTEGWIYHLPI